MLFANVLIEKGDIPLKPESSAVFPAAIATRLTSWAQIEYEDCRKLKYVENILSFMNLNHKNITFFNAVFKRDSGI